MGLPNGQPDFISVDEHEIPNEIRRNCKSVFDRKIFFGRSPTRGNFAGHSRRFILAYSLRNNRLSTQGIANVIAQLRREAGSERHVTPHMLRYTVATLLLQNGVNIRVVQEFLGHASIATTQRYTHISKEHLIAILQKRHPSLNFRTEAQICLETSDGEISGDRMAVRNDSAGFNQMAVQMLAF